MARIKLLLPSGVDRSGHKDKISKRDICFPFHFGFLFRVTSECTQELLRQAWGP